MTSKTPVGLVAGSGKIPYLAGERLKSTNCDVYVCALESEIDSRLKEISSSWMQFAPEALADVPSFFHDHDVQYLYLLGNVDKTRLYDDGNYSSAGGIVRTILDRVPNKGDRYLIKAAIRYLENQDLEVRGLDELFSDSLMPPGHQAGPPLDQSARQTIEYLLPLARKSADDEIGQTILGKRQSVVAVEAVEGTEATIERAGRLAGEGCIMVKSARTNQNSRFDMPVIGPETIKTLGEIGARALVAESKNIIWVRQEESSELAERADLSVIGESMPTPGIVRRILQWFNG